MEERCEQNRNRTKPCFYLRIIEKMETTKLKDVLKREEYQKFLRDKTISDNLILLAFGGSYAYGTNTEESDIDVRGIMFVPEMNLLGNKDFEQFEDNDTDTVIYGLNKLFKLLIQCNPNVCEILGCKEEHYVKFSDLANVILACKNKFLSKRAIYSFGGYANAQLRRLQNALARDTYSQEEKELHILGTLSHAMNDIVMKYNSLGGNPIKYEFPDTNAVHAFRECNEKMLEMERYRDFENGFIRLYPDNSPREDMKIEIFCDVYLNHYPLRDYKNIWSNMNAIVKDYDKLGKRNNKKDDKHLNKHAMHLVRLYLMCLDILERKEIVTYREKDHDLLMRIRNGDFQKDDHTFRGEFWEMVDEYEKRFKYAAENTSLPDEPNIDAIDEFLHDLNKRHLCSLYFQ